MRENILQNDFYAQKLPGGTQPQPKAFLVKAQGEGARLYAAAAEEWETWQTDEIFVGIDLVTGFFTVEGCSLLWDELCAFRGLDRWDAENVICVGQYIECREKFGLPI